MKSRAKPRLHVVCFKWSPTHSNQPVRYTAKHVNRLASMVKRNLSIPHRFVCITDDPTGLAPRIKVVRLWQKLRRLGGRYMKLMAFSPKMRKLVGARFVVIDLDAVVTGDLTPLFLRKESFVIWNGTAARTAYNSSMILMTAGARAKVWTRFDAQRSPRRIKESGVMGTDQAWISLCLGRGEATWTAKDGVLSYRKHVRPLGRLPKHARIVFFHGPWDPSRDSLRRKHPWIARHWR